jgi:hypothetical protein
MKAELVKDEGGRMKDEVFRIFVLAKPKSSFTLAFSSFRFHPSSFFL